MQKMLSRPPYRLSSSASMDIAEKLYQRGFISYPRTETDKFKEGTDLQHLIQVQTNDREWGAYANSLLMGGFCYPRDGGHDDSAHPPIHPTKPPEGLNQQENQVYDFIARHFLACCSKDGTETIQDTLGPSLLFSSERRLSSQFCLRVPLIRSHFVQLWASRAS